MAISTYLPYGAYELKARYQFNLTLATLLTVVLVTLAFFAAWAAIANGGDETVIIRDPVVVNDPIDFGPPIKVEKEGPIVDRRRPPVEFKGGGEIVLVNDTLPTESEDQFHTQEEISDWIDQVYTGSGDLGGVDVTFQPPVDPEEPPVLEIESVENPPEMIRGYKPDYPRLIEKAGIEGDVIVKVLVSEEGKVLQAVVLESSQTTALDDAAIEAAYKNIFKPGIQNGRPVRCWVKYKVAFRLNR